MSDIVERLRANMDKYPGFENMNTEAATEIERLREEVKRWKREALAWRAWKKCVVNYWTAENPDPQPLIDEMKAARAANERGEG